MRDFGPMAIARYYKDRQNPVMCNSCRARKCCIVLVSRSFFETKRKPNSLIAKLLGFELVPKKGLEPSRLAAHAPETCASTNSATWAFGLFASAKLVKFFELPTIFAQKVRFFFFARCGWAVLGQRFMPVSLL